MIASTTWAIWRTIDMPKPIGCPVFSLTTLNFMHRLADARSGGALAVAEVPDARAPARPGRQSTCTVQCRPSRGRCSRCCSPELGTSRHTGADGAIADSPADARPARPARVDQRGQHAGDPRRVGRRQRDRGPAAAERTTSRRRRRVAAAAGGGGYPPGGGGYVSAAAAGVAVRSVAASLGGGS